MFPVGNITRKGAGGRIMRLLEITRIIRMMGIDVISEITRIIRMMGIDVISEITRIIRMMG